MSKVFWCTQANGDAALEILFAEPVPLLKHILETREGTRHIKCPAFIDFTKNMYAIKAPLDMHITVDKENNHITVHNLPPEVLNRVIMGRGETAHGVPYTLTTVPRYLFYSTGEVFIESMQAFMEANDSVSNLMLVPGTYDISKWIRPVDFSFEVKDDKKDIHIKKGDVIFYVRFRAKDDSKVELERVEESRELNNVVAACTGVKRYMRNVPLKVLYAMAESFIKTLSFKKGSK
jgi:hypothetical protein